MVDEQEPTQAEVEAFRREQVLLDEVDATDDRYPRMFNLSAGWLRCVERWQDRGSLEQ
ncbi:hypothetical protein [Dactylosporangium sp. NPDC049140]|uniref:hypothetical protein n=1 Tax=Dactylosporangium sp. NPDC049140 TaxID=3155647 RepID=UPI0033F30DA4